MAQINLLPWREQLREQRQKEFFILLGGALIIAALIMLSLYLFLGARVRSQVMVNEFFKQQIAVLDTKISEINNLKQQKASIIERMEVIQELQATRPLVVRLFDELVKIMPSGVFVSEVKKEGNIITVVGKAESNTRVSEFMRNIEASFWINKPVLTQIIKREGKRRDFEVQFEQKPAHLIVEEFNTQQQSGVANGTQ